MKNNTCHSPICYMTYFGQVKIIYLSLVHVKNSSEKMGVLRGDS